MIKEAIGATMSIVGGIYLLWFILPQLHTAYTVTKSMVNTTDPTLATVVQIGDSVYSMLGFLTIIITLFVVILYFVRREPIDLRG